MRQLPEDRINSVLACASDAHRFMTEIDVLITRARRVIGLRPPERKKLRKSPSKSSAFTECRATLPADVHDARR
jgi:hypothetical protein